MPRNLLWPALFSVGMFVFPVTRRRRGAPAAERPLKSVPVPPPDNLASFLRQRRKLLALSAKLQSIDRSDVTFDAVRPTLARLQRITVFVIDYLQNHPKIADGDTDLNLLAALWNFVHAGWRQGQEQAAEMYVMLLIHYPESRFSPSAKAWLITHRYNLP